MIFILILYMWASCIRNGKDKFKKKSNVGLFCKVYSELCTCRGVLLFWLPTRKLRQRF